MPENARSTVDEGTNGRRSGRGRNLDRFDPYSDDRRGAQLTFTRTGAPPTSFSPFKSGRNRGHGRYTTQPSDVPSVPAAGVAQPRPPAPAAPQPATSAPAPVLGFTNEQFSTLLATLANNRGPAGLRM